jgi:phosphoserine phosphatase RsbU/P
MASRVKGRARRILDFYARDLTGEDVQRLFTRDTRDAYRFFARDINLDAVARLPWYQRFWVHTRLFMRAVLLKLTPARRALYGVALGCSLVGVIKLFNGFFSARGQMGPFEVWLPLPGWVEGTGWLAWGLLLTNLLLVLEIADRLSLKNDLEIARDIQRAMLPTQTYIAPGVVAHGVTRPANTVGGDFYDILPMTDGRLVIALGDVAGKGSPAALLMALLLAMMRTLVDEGLEDAALMSRLNVQICRHSPPSRFITLFFALYDPSSGRLVYVNAGHLPGLVRRQSGEAEHLLGGGIALGMFDHSTYDAHETTLQPGDWLVLYSDGITEAEAPSGQPFEEAGLERTLEAQTTDDPAVVGTAVLKAVEHHAQESKLADDLTILLLRRTPPPLQG